MLRNGSAYHIGLTQALALLASVPGAKTFSGTATFSGGLRLGTVEVFMQDATPATRANGTALVADDLWYETDSNIWWFWNGTYWLSCELHQIATSANGSAFTNLFYPTEIAQTQHDIYLVDLCSSLAVFTTNDGSNYHNLVLDRVTSGNGETQIAAHTTAASGVGTFVPIKTAVNTHLDLSVLDAKNLKLALEATGAPGAPYGGVVITYRWAHL